jgi:hypothetical protein
LTPDQLDKVRLEMYLKDTSEMMQGAIFSDTLQINGVKGREIAKRKVLPGGQVAYYLNVQLFFKNSLIQLIYGVGAPTEDEAASFFDKQKAVFMELARKTKISK